MKRWELLLTKLAEEAAEVQQRVSKALHFGLDEVEPGQFETNEARLIGELHDFMAVAQMLNDEGVLPFITSLRRLQAKKEKVERYLEYSAKCGRLDEQ